MAKDKNSLSGLVTTLRTTYGRAVPQVAEAGNVKRIVMTSPKLNYILGGGSPVGRIIELHGSESAGKSTIASYLGSQFQHRTDGHPKGVLYVDMEYTFDEKYAHNAGLLTDEDHFIFVQPLNGEEAFTIVEEAMKSGLIGLVIWDSVSTTPTATAMEEVHGKRSFGGGGLLFSEGLKKLNPVLSRYGVTLVLLRQMRAKVGFQSYGPPDQASGGGYAPKFYASWMARVSKGDEITYKDEVIGNKIKVKNVKSKIGFPKRSAELELYYATGFNPDSEYIDFIIDLGIVRKGGAWFSNEDWGMKVQGRDNLLAYLQDHRELFDKVKEQVNATFTTKSILDEKEDDVMGLTKDELGAEDEE